MNIFFAIVLVGALGFFIFFEIRGIIRDRKKRKELKEQSKKNLESAERNMQESYEQSDHS